MQSGQSKQFIIVDIIGFYRYSADSAVEAWAEHMTNDNSLSNSLLCTDHDKLRDILLDWKFTAIRATSLDYVWELVQ